MSRFLQIACLIFLLCVGMTCDGEFHYPVSVMDFTLSHMDNSGRIPPVEMESAGSVNWEAYVIRMELLFYDELHENGFSADYECRLKDPITHIQIFSANSDDPANFSDVTESFKNYQIISPEHKCNIVPIPMHRVEYLQNSTIYMALLEPVDAGTYRYEVTITLESGQTFTKQTDSVILH